MEIRASFKHFLYNISVKSHTRTKVAIDEIIIRFFGRSNNTCKMLNKLIKQSYKIFAFVENSYVWHFQMFLKKYGIGKLQKVDELILMKSIIL